MFQKLIGMATIASSHPRVQHRESEHARHQVMQSIQSRLNSEKTLGDRFADGLVKWFGSFVFGFLHVVVFALWILVNTGNFSSWVPVF
ncbi:MAG: hypothetical protein HYW88_03065, partial [Candidatus Sungbacteria bacterium]|nr:hypothetical protein [Candidatus Sungbacteria bacterium]